MRTWSEAAARAPARLAGAVTVVGSAVMIAVAPVAAYAEPAGWQPSFAADFADPALPAGCRPDEGTTDPPGTGYHRPADVTVSGGLLHLALHRPRQARQPTTSGSLACPQSAATYGRYEFSARVATGPGAFSSVQLRPVDPADAGALVNIEIEAVAGTDQLSVTVTGGSVPRSTHLVTAAPAAFHRYLVEAGPQLLTVAVDGQTVLSDRYPAAGTSRMIAFAVGTRDAAAEPTRPAPAGAGSEFTVDWVRSLIYDPSYGRPATVLAAVGGRRDGPDLRWIVPLVAGLAALGLLVRLGQARRPRRWPPPAHRA